MNLHEIIHTYINMGAAAGGAWLQELVREAGLDPNLVKHIQGCEKEANTYTVGLVDGTGERRGFATEDEAAAYIDTLPDHEDGRYYLDGPTDDFSNEEEANNE